MVKKKKKNANALCKLGKQLLSWCKVGTERVENDRDEKNRI